MLEGKSKVKGVGYLNKKTMMEIPLEAGLVTDSQYPFNNEITTGVCFKDENDSLCVYEFSEDIEGIEYLLLTGDISYSGLKSWRKGKLRVPYSNNVPFTDNNKLSVKIDPQNKRLVIKREYNGYVRHIENKIRERAAVKEKN